MADKLETGNENVFQMGENGSFRIFHQGLGSEWTSYNSIATVHVGKRVFAGVTDFFDGYLPTECVFEVIALPTVDYEDQ